MGRVRVKVVAVALAVGLVPTVAVAAPSRVDRWDSYREDRANEALLRRMRPAIDALSRMGLPGLAPCGRPEAVPYGTCLGSDTLSPLVAAARTRDRLRAAGATDLVVECRRQRRFEHCTVDARLHGTPVTGYVGPRLSDIRAYGAEVMLHADPAPGLLSRPSGGTPVPLPG